ncbi:hypothetical protein BCR44DRAFT_1511760 [Catenaria anguillulae PL171]|uniref:Uncharacterized protein n=1 Tax=Catenaria anguillulae PL171 TaxID=765915 RepID=A0A1Y2HWU6_9FUNG|nr:hypothetical protein BCR44DRAFT_1511760 [Catenaria anguillulae PL171]
MASTALAGENPSKWLAEDADASSRSIQTSPRSDLRRPIISRPWGSFFHQHLEAASPRLQAIIVAILAARAPIDSIRSALAILQSAQTITSQWALAHQALMAVVVAELAADVAVPLLGTLAVFYLYLLYAHQESSFDDDDVPMIFDPKNTLQLMSMDWSTVPTLFRQQFADLLSERLISAFVLHAARTFSTAVVKFCPGVSVKWDTQLRARGCPRVGGAFSGLDLSLGNDVDAVLPLLPRLTGQLLSYPFRSSSVPRLPPELIKDFVIVLFVDLFKIH